MAWSRAEDEIKEVCVRKTPELEDDSDDISVYLRRRLWGIFGRLLFFPP